jgi:hypothetical protein
MAVTISQPALAIGPPGSAATIAIGDVTTGAAGSDADVVNSGTSNAAVLDFTIPRGDTGNDGEDGAPGADSTVPGPAGAGYGGTSVTSLAVASSGSKTLTTQAGLAYTASSRIRVADAADPATNWMEGVVTSYSGTTLIFTADRSSGSGTFTDWAISIAGEPSEMVAQLNGGSNVSAPVLNFIEGGGTGIEVAPGAFSNVDVTFKHRAPVTLTDASTVAVDSTTGDLFRLALGGSHTLGNPTGAVDGDSFIVEVTWGGSYTLTLDTKYLVADNVDFVGAQTSGVIVELGVIYHGASDKFRVVAASMFTP